MTTRMLLTQTAMAMACLASTVVPAGEPELRQYVIERNIPGASELSAEALRDVAARSNTVLAELGDGIRWVQSYVAGDTIYCVYQAKDPEIIRLHAEKGGFPVDRITPVNAVIDPSTGR